jgi:hypothetical protein
MDEFMEEFMLAMKEVFPKLLVQFEDFSTDNAFKYLEVFRDRARVFNDDVYRQLTFSRLTFADLNRVSDSRHWRCGAVGFHKRRSPCVRRLWATVNRPQNTLLWCRFGWYWCR